MNRMALFIMATLCNTNYSIRRLEKNKLRLKENEKWTKYGKKCMKLQRQFRMEGKYRIMLKPEKFPLRYIQHPERYTGVCIDTCSTLGICAERNAIFQMITNGEQSFSRVLAIMPDGKNGAPCGACRELMVQLMPDTYKNVEILMDYDTERIVTLGELTPEWWI